MNRRICGFALSLIYLAPIGMIGCDSGADSGDEEKPKAKALPTPEKDASEKNKEGSGY